ncbi:MAG TPA: LamG-like jellyroll fold domain-containing protein, partial [Thermoguttaceae bacterium]|nr:LamG-like jellyroll fold domain-containing protein [Thermoguttaceae bacterium]
MSGGDGYAVVDTVIGRFDMETMSIAVWVKGQPKNYEPYISKFGMTNTGPEPDVVEGWQLRRGGGDAVAFTTRGTAPDSGHLEGDSTAAIDGDWHLVVATVKYTPNTPWDPLDPFAGTFDKRIYVDGVLDAQRTETQAAGAFEMGITNTLGLLTFGARHDINVSFFPDPDPNVLTGWANFFDGQLDDIRIYKDRVLTPIEVAGMYSTRTAPNVAGFPVLMDGADSELVSESISAMNLGAFTAKSGVLTVNSAFDKPITFASATIDAEGYTLAGIAPDANTTITGNVLLKGGVFSVGGNGPVTLAGVTIDANATAVGIATPGGNVNFGSGINGSAVTAASFNFAKSGPGRFTATAGTFAANSMTKAVMDVHQGTMTMIGEAAWAGSNNVVLSGGTLEITGVNTVIGPGPVDAVSQWLFESGGGDILRDSAGGHDGVITGATWVNDPIRGSVLSFDGTDDYVDVPTAAGVFASAIANEELTISLWQYGDPNIDKNCTIFFAGNGGTRIAMAHMPWGGNVVWDAGNSYDRISKGAVEAEFDGQWNHWVFTKNMGEMKAFLNGVEWNSGTGMNRSLAGITGLKIGSRADGGEGYPGLIDDFMVFDRVLSPEEIGQLTLNQYGQLSSSDPIEMPHRDFTVVENSTLRAATSNVATFGSLTIENGILTIGGGAAQVNFTGGTSVTGDGGVNINLGMGKVTDFGNTVVEEGARLTLDGYGPAFEATNDPNPQVLIKAGGVLHSRADSTSIAFPINVLGASGDLPGGQLILDGFGSEIVEPVTIGPGGLLSLGGGEATFNGSVVIGAGGTLSVGGTEGFFLAPVTIGENATLSVTGTGNIFADSVTIHDGAQVLATGQADFSEGVTIVGPATQVGFDGSAAVDFGAINGGGIQDLVVAKVGAGTWPLSNAGSHLTNMGPNSKLSMAEGTLKLTLSGALPTGGASIELSGGTLEIWPNELVPAAYPAGAVGQWLGGSGNVLTDSSGNGRDGAITGATWVNDPERGWVLDFEGNDVVDIPASTFATVGSAITIALWQYGDEAIQPQNDHIFEGQISTNAGDKRGVASHLPFGNQNVYWDAGGTAGCCTDRMNKVASPADWEGQWNHWVFTKDTVTGEQKIFLNGVEWMSATGRITSLAGIDSFTIGTGSGGYYDGMIDDFVIYDRALTAEEIANGLYGPNGLGPHALLPAINFAAQDISVIGDSTLNLMTEETGSFRALTFAGNGVMTVTGLATATNFSATTVLPGVAGGINAEMPVSGGSLTIGDGTTVVASGPVTFGGLTLPGTVGDGEGPDRVTLEIGGGSPSFGTINGGLTAGGPFTLTKSGAGMLSVAPGGENELFGMANATIEVRDGVLEVPGTIPDPLSGANQVVLSGGTFSAYGAMSIRWDELDWAKYNGANQQANLAGVDDGVANGLNGGMLSLTPSSTAVWTGDTNDPGSGDNYGMSWVGVFKPPVDGDYEFYTHGDDQEALWIDLDGNGDYEAGAGELITDNIYGGWNEPKTGMVTLDSTKVYDFAFVAYEGGGGEFHELKLTPPGGAQEFLHVDAGGVQAGWWGRRAFSGIDLTMLDFTVTADSTLNVQGADGMVGNLTLNSGILSVTGASVGGVAFETTTVDVPTPALPDDPPLITGINAQVEVTGGPLTIPGGVLHNSGQLVEFDSTTIPNGATAVGFEVEGPMELGPITGEAHPVTGAGPAVVISKSGSVELALAQPNVGLENAVFDAREGVLKMIGTDPWGNSTQARLSGGTLKLVGLVDNSPIPLPSLPDKLVLHLDAGDVDGDGNPDIIADGTPIGTWADTSGNDKDVAQVTAASQPTYWAGAVNGEPVLRFDGTDDYLAGPAVLQGGDDTFTFVAVWNAAALKGQVVVEQAASGTGRRASLIVESSGKYGFCGESNDSNSLGPYAAGEWNLSVMTLNGQPSNNILVWDNGNLQTGSINITTQNVGTTGVRVGNKLTNNAENFNGDIAEILIYNDILTDEERTAVDVHLANKYGLDTASKLLEAIDLRGTSFSVTADSTLEANTDFDAALGPLTIDSGFTLTTTGSPISFTSTAASGAGDAVIGIHSNTDTTLTGASGLDGGGRNLTIAIGGSGRTNLTRPGVNLENATFRLDSGELAGLIGPGGVFGSAEFAFNGGRLLVSSPGGNQNFDNPLSVTGGGTFAATAGLPGGVSNVEVSLINAVTFDNDAVLSLEANDGYTLNLNGPMSGAGGIEATAGIVNVNPIGDKDYSGLTAASGGAMMTIDAPLPNTSALRVTGGATIVLNQPVTTSGPSQTTVNAGTLEVNAALATGTVNISNSGTVNVTAGGSLAADALTIDNGSLTVPHPLDLTALTFLRGTFNRPAGAAGDLSVSGSLTVGTSLDMTGSTLTTTAGATDVNVATGGQLIVSGPLLGAQMNVDGAVHTAGFSMTDVIVGATGSLNTSADSNAATVKVNGNSTVNTHGNLLTVGDTLKIPGLLTATVTAGDFGVVSDNLALGVKTLAINGTVTVSGPPPLPTEGLQLWLDAGEISGLSDGDTVTQWLDRSGLDHHADNLGRGDPKYVASGLNGMPVVSFTDDQLFTTYNFDALSEYSIFTVARYTGGDSERIISSKDHNWLFGFHGNGDEKWHAEAWIQQTGTANTDWHLHAGTMTGDADPMAAFWKDGNLLTENNTNSNNTNYKPGRLSLGGYNTTEFSNAEVAEVLIYDSVLSDDDLNTLGDYLTEKYSLTTSYPGAGVGGDEPVSLNNLTGAGTLIGDVAVSGKTSPGGEAPLFGPSAGVNPTIRHGLLNQHVGTLTFVGYPQMVVEEDAQGNLISKPATTFEIFSDQSDKIVVTGTPTIDSEMVLDGDVTLRGIGVLWNGSVPQGHIASTDPGNVPSEPLTLTLVEAENAPINLLIGMFDAPEAFGGTHIGSGIFNMDVHPVLATTQEVYDQNVPGKLLWMELGQTDPLSQPIPEDMWGLRYYPVDPSNPNSGFLPKVTDANGLTYHLAYDTLTYYKDPAGIPRLAEDEVFSTVTGDFFIA